MQQCNKCLFSRSKIDQALNNNFIVNYLHEAYSSLRYNVFDNLIECCYGVLKSAFLCVLLLSCLLAFANSLLEHFCDSLKQWTSLQLTIMYVLMYVISFMQFLAHIWNKCKIPRWGHICAYSSTFYLELITTYYLEIAWGQTKLTFWPLM